MKIYRTDDGAPEWMRIANIPAYDTVANCPQCKGEIRYVVARTGPVWRCTSCRVELEVHPSNGHILSARNLQPWHLGPPEILCSKCGESLVKASRGYRCQPCGREVRA